MFHRNTISVQLLVIALAAACEKDTGADSSGAAASATTEVLAKALAESSAGPFEKAAAPAKTTSDHSFPIPTGPRFMILAGKGIGPIRIGATVQTIERHMGVPCDVKSKSVCRYVGRAVEFELKDGVTEAIVVHRVERPAGKNEQGKPVTYGIFNGILPPDLQPAMHKREFEVLGKPKRVEKVETPGPNNTLERQHYDGMILEFDRLDNGNVVLGGVRIVADPNAESLPPATPKDSAKNDAAKATSAAEKTGRKEVVK